MDSVVEIITGRDRRRRWSVAQKLEVVAETHEPGARVREVAARHGVCESLVFSWRRQVREGSVVAPEMAVFVPMQMHDVAAPSVADLCHPDEKSLSAATRLPSRSGLIEIELGDGRQVRGIPPGKAAWSFLG